MFKLKLSNPQVSHTNQILKQNFIKGSVSAINKHLHTYG